MTTSSVIITGAAGGMGQATCLHFAKQGWMVIAMDHNQARLNALAAQHLNITPLCVELDDPCLIDQLAHTLQNKPIPCALINLAGVSKGSPIETLTDEDWQKSFAVNVTPAMRLTQFVAPLFKQNQRGSIVNVGSPVGYIGARKPSYAASKAALIGLTMSCARNLGADNIRVNLLLPGPTITEMTKDWSIEKQQDIAQSSFLKRLCQAEEIANTLFFLASEQSSYITGSIIDMTSGSMWGH